MIFLENELGFLFETTTHTVFFGKKNANFQNLQNSNSKIEFTRMRQTHSDICQEITLNQDQKFEADALITTTRQLGICCSTADCIPFLAYSPTYKRIFSIHAGWRGIANEIILKTLKPYPDSEMQIYIGPHIGFDSFEVGLDVRDQILKQNNLDEKYCRPSTDQNHKCYLNLSAVVDDQLSSLKIRPENIHRLEFDTVQDLRFHSFRRDKEKSGRQLSYIYLHL